MLQLVEYTDAFSFMMVEDFITLLYFVYHRQLHIAILKFLSFLLYDLYEFSVLHLYFIA